VGEGDFWRGDNLLCHLELRSAGVLVVRPDRRGEGIVCDWRWACEEE
jgi:hypothetical protein